MANDWLFLVVGTIAAFAGARLLAILAATLGLILLAGALLTRALDTWLLAAASLAALRPER
jgi:hypothetical protein